MDRPPFDFYNRVHVHKAVRAKPEPEGPTVYADATPRIPDDAPKPPAKFGSRYFF